MLWRPTRSSRDRPISSDHPVLRLLPAILLGILVAAGPLSADHRSAGGSDEPMPDPCEVAPVLPFCR